MTSVSLTSPRTPATTATPRAGRQRARVRADAVAWPAPSAAAGWPHASGARHQGRGRGPADPAPAAPGPVRSRRPSTSVRQSRRWSGPAALPIPDSNFPTRGQVWRRGPPGAPRRRRICPGPHRAGLGRRTPVQLPIPAKNGCPARPGRRGSADAGSVSDFGQHRVVGAPKPVHDAAGAQPDDRNELPPAQVHSNPPHKGLGRRVPRRRGAPAAPCWKSASSSGSFKCHPSSSPPERRRSVMRCLASTRSEESKYWASSKCSTGSSTLPTPRRFCSGGASSAGRHQISVQFPHYGRRPY